MSGVPTELKDKDLSGMISNQALVSEPVTQDEPLFTQPVVEEEIISPQKPKTMQGDPFAGLNIPGQEFEDTMMKTKG